MDRDRHRAKNRTKKWIGIDTEPKIEPKSGETRSSQRWRNQFDQKELSKKPLHTIRILGLTSYIVVVVIFFQLISYLNLPRH